MACLIWFNRCGDPWNRFYDTEGRFVCASQSLLWFGGNRADLLLWCIGLGSADSQAPDPTRSTGNSSPCLGGKQLCVFLDGPLDHLPYLCERATWRGAESRCCTGRKRQGCQIRP